MPLSQLDRAYLRSLRIRPDDDIAVERTQRASIAEVAALRDQEQMYVEALKDPQSPRDAEGHPKIAVLAYLRAHANLRSVAIRLRSEAYNRSEKCKCGAICPSATCYL